MKPAEIALLAKIATDMLILLRANGVTQEQLEERIRAEEERTKALLDRLKG
jgi:hypothetical protein